jgi:hypothetical protein
LRLLAFLDSGQVPSRPLVASRRVWRPPARCSVQFVQVRIRLRGSPSATVAVLLSDAF